MYGSTSFTHL